ncbi:excalibur calcium-binding domain-containing protein [Shinella sp.]|uniref:excalibur calcium-binding domain-containing protein n=1 Tax=Shinella sp. TaxID=1870904 RepID=UPI0039C8C620
MRGATSSGDEYLGRHTSGLIGSSFYIRNSVVAGDRDCSSFASAAGAQRFFLAEGGPYSDRHALDRDGDGIACEFGNVLRASVARHRKPMVVQSRPRSFVASSQCFVGPRGGTYTITASGNKNYGGC